MDCSSDSSVVSRLQNKPVYSNPGNNSSASNVPVGYWHTTLALVLLVPVLVPGTVRLRISKTSTAGILEIKN